MSDRPPSRRIAAAPPARAWREYPVRLGARTIPVATRAGVLADGDDDPGGALLARHLTCRDGETVLHLGTGNGLAAAATPAGARLLCTDRHLANVHATRRTLALNGRDGATVVHALGVARPDHDEAHDEALRIADASVDAVALRIPHEKGALLPLLLDAHRVLREGGRCWLAGGTHEGVKPAVTLLETLFGGVAVAAQGSGHRLVVATKRGHHVPDVPVLRTPFADRAHFRTVPVALRGERVTLHVRPGVFSWEHLDEATALLGEAMRIPQGARVLDLGCGSGVLGIVAARLAGTPATFADADAEALRCARQTLAAAGMADARMLTSDAGESLEGDEFDVVVTNPPFHHGKATTLDVPRAFIADAHALLARGGWLQLVANRTLPYEAMLREHFGDHAVVIESPRFKVLAARKR